MKAGDQFDCPHCKTNTFLKKESVMDGWDKVGDILSCASCSQKIADIEIEDKESGTGKNNKADKLANFLGVEKEDKTVLSAEDDEQRFCRDCNHFIKHPFLTRCSLHEKDVNPMGDCSDFERIIEDEDS